ncbi:MAG: hypothetical protein ABI345_13655, partial [Jatrophihabitans sp.]
MSELPVRPPRVEVVIVEGTAIERSESATCWPTDRAVVTWTVSVPLRPNVTAAAVSLPAVSWGRGPDAVGGVEMDLTELERRRLADIESRLR